MYQVGEWIFYGNVGACQVREISKRKVPGMEQERLYYTLQPVSDNCSIAAPVEAGKVFMRPLITREEAERLIAHIPQVEPTIYHNPVLRQLTEHYEALLNTHDCGMLIEMTMSIYAKRQEALEQKRKLGAVDEKFMRRAEDLLFGELAVALDIPKNQVPAYIQARLEEQAARQQDA